MSSSLLTCSQLATLPQRSPLVKHYLFLDMLLTSAQFVSDLGGDVDQVLPEMQEIEALLAQSKDHRSDPGRRRGKSSQAPWHFATAR